MNASRLCCKFDYTITSEWLVCEWKSECVRPFYRQIFRKASEKQTSNSRTFTIILKKLDIIKTTAAQQQQQQQCKTIYSTNIEESNLKFAIEFALKFCFHSMGFLVGVTVYLNK